MKFPKHLVRNALAFAICLAGTGGSHAAVTYADPADILIPFTFGGVYLDIVTGGESSSSRSGAADPTGDSYTVSYSEPASGDWDVNFFLGGAFVAHNTTFQPYRDNASDNMSAIHNVGIDEVIDGTPIDPEPASGASAPLGTPDFGGSGTGTGGGLDGNLTATHMGMADNQFSSNTEGYIAFVLDPGTPEEKFGWIRVTLNDNGTTGLIHDWAYSDTSILVGQIPEPGTAALLLLAAAALLPRRRV